MVVAPGRLLHRRGGEFFEGLREGLIAFARVALDEDRSKREPLPDFPERLRYLWLWFVELHRKRSGGFGPEALKDSEIEASIRLRGHVVTLWDVEVVDELDEIWVEAANARASKNSRTTSGPAVRDEASVDDGAGIKRILKNLAAKAGITGMKKKKKASSA